MSINPFRNNRGFTLLEVVAGVVIITIILLSFVTILNQTKKTTVAAENTVSSTYIGQQSLEEIYALSNTSTFTQLPSYLTTTKEHLQTLTSTTNELKVKYPHEQPNYSIILTIKKIVHSATNISASQSVDLYSVIVQVYENHQLKNTVESIYQFR